MHVPLNRSTQMRCLLSMLIFVTPLSLIPRLSAEKSDTWMAKLCESFDCPLSSLSTSYGRSDANVYTAHRCTNCKGPWEDSLTLSQAAPSSDLITSLSLSQISTDKRQPDSKFVVYRVTPFNPRRECAVMDGKAAISYVLRVARPTAGGPVKFFLNEQSFPGMGMKPGFVGIPNPEKAEPFARLFAHESGDRESITGDVFVLLMPVVKLDLGKDTSEITESLQNMMGANLVNAKCLPTKPKSRLLGLFTSSASCIGEKVLVSLDVYCHIVPEEKRERLLVEKLELLISRYITNAGDQAQVALDLYFKSLDKAVLMAAISAVSKNKIEEPNGGLCMMYLLKDAYNTLPDMIMSLDYTPKFGIKHSVIDSSFRKFTKGSRVETTSTVSPTKPPQTQRPQYWGSNIPTNAPQLAYLNPAIDSYPAYPQYLSQHALQAPHPYQGQTYPQAPYPHLHQGPSEAWYPQAQYAHTYPVSQPAPYRTYARTSAALRKRANGSVPVKKYARAVVSYGRPPRYR